MSEMNSVTGHCRSCKKPLTGRHDKKFCNDACRNDFNNLLKSTANKYVRAVNSSLAKNRRILKSMLQEGKDTVKTSKERLMQLGFNFNYFTDTYTNKSEKTYYYCYEYGYLSLDSNWYLVVRKNDD
jgi:hypothetical protein